MKKSKSDLFFDKYIEDQAYLNRLDFPSASNFKESLEDISLEIEIFLEENKLQESKKQLLTNFQKNVKDQLRKIYKELKTDLSDDMKVSSELAYKTSSNAFKKIFDIDQIVSFSQIPKSAIAEFSNLNRSIRYFSSTGIRSFNTSNEIDKLFTNHSKKYRNAIKQSLETGLSTKEASRLFKKNSEKIDGLKNAHVETLTRTAIAESMSLAREKNEEENFSSVISGHMWITVFDTRTSVICASLGGRIAKKRSEFRVTPPAHPRCRSILMPITDFTDTKNLSQNSRVWDEKIYADKDRQLHTKFEKKDQRQINVENPGNKSKFTSFDGFLSQLPKDRQVQWLGPEKYKIYQTGKLGMSQLIDGSGKIRTVKELASLIGLKKEDLSEIKRRDIKAYKPEISKSAKKIIQERLAEQKK